MNAFEKVKDLDAVWSWSEFYLEQGDNIIDETVVEKIRNFKEELEDFLMFLRNRWMGGQLNRLRDDNRQRIREVYQELHQLELDIARHMIEVQRDQELLDDIKSLAFPET